MNEEQRIAVRRALDNIVDIDDSDMGQCCYRVARRLLAEVLGLPVEDYMLLKDTKATVKPMYCPSQY